MRANKEKLKPSLWLTPTWIMRWTAGKGNAFTAELHTLPRTWKTQQRWHRRWRRGAPHQYWGPEMNDNTCEPLSAWLPTPTSRAWKLAALPPLSLKPAHIPLVPKINQKAHKRVVWDGESENYSFSLTKWVKSTYMKTQLDFLTNTRMWGTQRLNGLSKEVDSVISYPQLRWHLEKILSI